MRRVLFLKKVFTVRISSNVMLGVHWPFYGDAITQKEFLCLLSITPRPAAHVAEVAIPMATSATPVAVAVRCASPVTSHKQFGVSKVRLVPLLTSLHVFHEEEDVTEDVSTILSFFLLYPSYFRITRGLSQLSASSPRLGSASLLALWDP